MISKNVRNYATSYWNWLVNNVVHEVTQLLWLGHAKCFPILIKQEQYSKTLALKISSLLMSLHESNNDSVEKDGKSLGGLAGS